MKSVIDHLVVLAADLESGCAYIEQSLGAAPLPGGKHPLMGTHNAVLRLQRGVYLEVLAIDPEAEAPGHPRWFGLDEPHVRERLAAGLYLAHWALRLERPHDIDRLAAQYPQKLPKALSLARGELRWRMCPRQPGATSPVILQPSLIQWLNQTHPGASLPDAGLAMARLTGFVPVGSGKAEELGETLRWLGAEGQIAVQETLVETELVAEIETQAGVRALK
ncbi:MAG: VOC family protein [Candidatus Protistobacter heckmanni]|nr:VOC family protein [Candidatus Protistobacter heckmanni]